jgi:hypothetical protein
MNDEILEQAKARMQEALRKTQEQTEDAATQLGGLLRKGAAHVRAAADAAAQTIRDDLDRRS